MTSSRRSTPIVAPTTTTRRSPATRPAERAATTLQWSWPDLVLWWPFARLQPRAVASL